MSQQINAIFENGVLRPLEPLRLPDQMRVKVIVDATQDTESAESPPKKIDAQKAALTDLLRELDALPQTPNNDGWSAAQHDDLLYGHEP